MVGFQVGKMTACGGLRKNRRESAESPPPVSELQGDYIHVVWFKGFF